MCTPSDALSDGLRFRACNTPSKQAAQQGCQQKALAAASSYTQSAQCVKRKCSMPFFARKTRSSCHSSSPELGSWHQQGRQAVASPVQQSDVLHPWYVPVHTALHTAALLGSSRTACRMRQCGGGRQKPAIVLSRHTLACRLATLVLTRNKCPSTCISQE